MNNIEILENCWLMKTNHVLDEENKKVRQAIENLLLELKGTKIDLKLQETENENLIQENKELKEKVKCLECEIEIKKYCKVDEVINDLIYYKNLAKEYQGNYIPKSKVKEKIEELRDEFEYLGEDNKRVNKMAIETLQELLGEN